MLRYALVLCAVGLQINAALAAPPAYCDNRQVAWEPIDGRFMWLPYAIISHALAEKYCGAKPYAWRRRIIDFLVENGCGPETKIHQNIKLTLDKIEAANLELLAADGDPSARMSPSETEVWAKSTVKQFGGCSRIVRWHDAHAR